MMDYETVFNLEVKLLAELCELGGNEVGAIGLGGVPHEVFLVIGFRRVKCLCG